MKTYHKIQTLFLRDPNTNYKKLMEGHWSKPEFAYLQDVPWIIEEKIDGTNIRIMWDGVNVKIGGKTDNAQLHMDLVRNIEAMVDVEKVKELFVPKEDQPLEVCLYGEGCGAGIQKGGGNYSPDKTFILFDVNINGMWLERENVADIAEKLGLKTAPVIDNLSLNGVVELCREGFKSQYGDFTAEGIIARPATELTNRFGERVITKLKCTDFHAEE